MASIELPLLNCTQDARERRVRLRAALGSITAADLPRDHGWAQRVLGAPVSRGDRIRFEQKGEDRWEFDGEMGGEALGDARATGPIDERVELVLQMPTRNRDAVRRDVPMLIVVPDPQRVLKDPLHAWGKAAFLMVPDQRPTAPQQMREARLMERVLEPSIGRPAVAHEDTTEGGPRATSPLPQTHARAESHRSLCRASQRPRATAAARSLSTRSRRA
jgi:hypothetical protein